MIGRFINQFAAFLSTANGFVATFLVLIVGTAIGALAHFNDGFMLAFNLFLSIVAIVVSGIILVSAARSEAAIQVKLDYLIEYSRATNRAIGIEHKDLEEIEAERLLVEGEAAAQVKDAIREEVVREVGEQLDERGGTA